MSGPEGSSTKGFFLGAAGVPGPSNLLAIAVFFQAMSSANHAHVFVGTVVRYVLCHYFGRPFGVGGVVGR